MILFEQDSWEDFPRFYAKVRLSSNQIEALLQQYIEPSTNITIQMNDEHKIQVNTTEIINMIMDQLKRNEVIEIIHHLYLINKRNSDTTAYLRTILIGSL